MLSEVLKETERERVVIVSDPPFNIGYHYNGYDDKMDEGDYYSFLSSIFSLTPSVVIHYPENLYKLSFEMEMFPEEICTWVYNSNCAKQHRDIAYFNIKPDFGLVRQPYKDMRDKRNIERMVKGCKGSKIYDWWYVNQVKNRSRIKCNHPCQMPVEVMCNVVGILPTDSIIIDPFMGSGTTGVAVVEMNKKQDANRQFIGIELDEGYFNIANQRLKEALSKTSIEDFK